MKKLNVFVTVIVILILVFIGYKVFTNTSPVPVEQPKTALETEVPKVHCQPPFALGEYEKCYPSDGKE